MTGGEGSGRQLLKNLDESLRHPKFPKGAKLLHELVVSERFTVREVLCTNTAVSYTPESEVVHGDNSPQYQSGFRFKMSIKVTPEGLEILIPVRELLFYGNSPVRGSDYVEARIPRFREIKTHVPKTTVYDNGVRLSYVDRKFKESELAIELSILTRDGKVLRTDRAAGYKKFSPKAL